MTKKTEKEKLTLEKILQQRKILDETVNAPYYSKLFNCEIEIEEHPVSKLSAIVNKDYDDPLRADLELIYAFCPIFRSKKLHDKLGVEDPIDAVELSFGHNLNEINALARAILSRYGYGGDVFEKIKKQ